MKLALVGIGNASVRGHLPAIARLERTGTATLVAAADPDPNRRSTLAALGSPAPTFPTLADLLAATSPEVLVVATDPRRHPELVAAGIERGCHVVCEKPLALNQSDYRRVTETCARHPRLALVPVHQYRYSAEWRRIWRWIRLAARLRLPYSITVDVQRTTADTSAVSAWREDSGSGGMLADAGVHFIALAATVGRPLTALQSVRVHDTAAGERVTATARLDSGRLAIRLWRGAPRRHTRVVLRSGPAALTWSDQFSQIRLGGLDLPRKRVDALSDRHHVDKLYAPLYRDLAAGLSEPSWRARRTAEALSVGRTLVTLLDQIAAENGVAR